MATLTGTPITVLSGSGILDTVNIECIVDATYGFDTETAEIQCYRNYPSKYIFPTGYTCTVDISYIWKSGTEPIIPPITGAGSVFEAWYPEGNIYFSGSGLISSSDWTAPTGDEVINGSFSFAANVYDFDAISGSLT